MQSKVILLRSIVTFFVVLTINGLAFAQSAPEASPKNWRPVLDSSKCVAAVAWAVPTLAGLGVAQFGAVLSDVGALLVEGKACFTANKLIGSSYRPVLQTLIEMGCVAPLGDIQNPKYYTFAKELQNQNSGFRLFHCEQ